jgi:hypothetical protein
MTRDSAAKQPVAAGVLVTPMGEKQPAERCRLKEALEDDEVHEALKPLHTEPHAKAAAGKPSQRILRHCSV